MNILNCLALVTVATVGCMGQNFNRNLVGVTYSPYTDNLPGRNWDQYSLDDIMSDLRTIRNKFSAISTYSMGTASYNDRKHWSQCDSNALIARAAARVNNERGQRLNVNIGVYQKPGNKQELQREIDNAYAAAADANGISSGTVWGITFTNEYFNDKEGDRMDEVLNMINANKGRQGLRVGARTHVCGQITGGNLQGRFQRLARESDYIYCNIYPSEEHTRLGPNRAAKEVINYFLYLQSEFRKINSKIEILIGETGWPSEGNSFNKSPNTVRNLIDYWTGINQYATNNNVKVQMFEAVDEPWKSRDSLWKAEGHYGLWYKPSNGNRQLQQKS